MLYVSYLISWSQIISKKLKLCLSTEDTDDPNINIGNIDYIYEY